jgi:hypothetical protein
LPGYENRALEILTMDNFQRNARRPAVAFLAASVVKNIALVKI